jgi:hypothetical protein
MGTYKDKQGHYLIFHPGNQVEFLFEDCFSFGDQIITGFGNYKLRHNKIVINTKSGYLGGSKSEYSYSEDSIKHNTFEFHVVDTAGEPLPSASININKKYLLVTDFEGNAQIVLPASFNDSLFIFVVAPSYQELRIKKKFIDGARFKVKLADGGFVYLDDNKLIINYKFIKDTLICVYKDDLCNGLTYRKEHGNISERKFKLTKY